MILAISILDRLFGLTRVSWADPRAALGWRWPLPAWGWAMIVVAAALVAAWSYRRLLGPTAARVVLAVVRAALLLVLAALLVGPMLVINQEQVEPDALLVLVDQSASMDIQDMAGDSGSSGGVSGDDQPVSRSHALEAAIRSHAELFGSQKLGHDRKVLWLGFSGNTYEINPFKPDGWTPPPGERQATAIRTAVEQALQRGAGQPISGIVLLSDGRSPQPTGGALVRRLQQQAVSVFAVPLGAQTPTLDLGLAQVEAPEKAFINDAVPVTVWLDHYPDDARVDPARVLVRLVDAQSGKVLDEKHPAPGDERLSEPVHLGAASPVVGPAPWRVELVYDAPAGADARKVLITRGREDVRPELVEQPLGVLYVEGYPRWEFRYLKNMLLREKRIKSSTMLVSADRGFAQEGSLPIARLPATAAEFKPYDVVILGDVPAGYFSPDQLKLINEHVATNGAGLLWIGGERDTPRSYEGTPLAGLLPMRSPGAVVRLDPGPGAFHLRPAPLAEALQVLRLGASGSPGNAGGSSWPQTLPGLLWAQDLGELKNSVEILAATEPPGGRGAPLVTRMRYGAGQALYVATDETWRWRYARGELYFEQFWMSLVQMLGRSRLEQGSGRAVLSVSSRRLEPEQTAVVRLRINDELLSQRGLGRIAVAVTRGDESDPAAVVERIELLPVGDATGPDGGAEYQALWRPVASGRLTLRVVEPALDDLRLTRGVEVVRADDELRQPAPDPEKLAALAEATGGKVVLLDKLDDLAGLIPNRARRTPNDIREPLWNSYFALTLVVLLLTGEWIGRKAIRLV